MILVTGGTGLVGSHVLLSLLRTNRDIRIRATTRKLDNIAKFRNIAAFYPDIAQDQIAQIEWIQADMNDEDSIYAAMDGASQIYHCAASVSFDPRQEQGILETNIGGTAFMVNMALQLGIEKFCFVSSIAAIGGSNTDDMRTEEMDWDAGRNRSYYSLSKYLSEMEVWRGIAEGLPAVIVNPSVIIGPGIWGESSTVFFERASRGMRYFVPGGTGFVDVRDVTDVMIALMDSCSWGQRYILNAENLTYRDFFALMCRSLGQKEAERPLPRWLAEIAWRIEWLRSQLTRTRPRLTRMNVITSYETSKYSSEKVISQLNHRFIAINESINHTANLFLKNIAKT